MLCAVAAITIAPASTTPWIEFAADISGVCKVAGTLLMTSKPTQRLRTKMMKSVRSMKAFLQVSRLTAVSGRCREPVAVPASGWVALALARVRRRCSEPVLGGSPCRHGR